MADEVSMYSGNFDRFGLINNWYIEKLPGVSVE